MIHDPLMATQKVYGPDPNGVQVHMTGHVGDKQISGLKKSHDDGTKTCMTLKFEVDNNWKKLEE